MWWVTNTQESSLQTVCGLTNGSKNVSHMESLPCPAMPSESFSGNSEPFHSQSRGRGGGFSEQHGKDGVGGWGGVSYLSMFLCRLYSSMLHRDVLGSGLMSNSTMSLIYNKYKKLNFISTWFGAVGTPQWRHHAVASRTKPWRHSYVTIRPDRETIQLVITSVNWCSYHAIMRSP